MKGFANAENSCFLNAALQCLLYAPQLTNYCLSPCPEDDMQHKRVNACTLASEYVSLAKAYWLAPIVPGEALNPEPLRSALAKLSRGLANRRQQHDAHEAMMAVLQGLHAAFARTEHVRESMAEPHVDMPAWKANNKNNYSILTEMFQGQMRVDVSGPAGGDGGEGYRSTAYEHFWDLQLAVDGAASLSAALARFLEPQAVDGYRHADAYIRVDVTRHITYAPLLLVVHLKRFDNRRKKIDKFVDYSVELDVPVGPRGITCRYALFAACLHSGEATSGHYAAMCEAHGRWFYLDDAASREVTDMNSIIQRDAYVLLFRKQPDFH